MVVALAIEDRCRINGSRREYRVNAGTADVRTRRLNVEQLCCTTPDIVYDKRCRFDRYPGRTI
jgi:hypothetical protein